jgi:hypothetical protein
VDLLSIFIGVVVGGVATAIAWNLSTRNVRNPETTKLTALWTLKDLSVDGGRPAIMAERIDGLQLPMGSKVIVPSGSLGAVHPDIVMSCEVRMHPDVRVNAAIGKDRAIVFSGHVNPKSFALVTMEEAMVRRLQTDFQRMWGEAAAHVEQVAISDLAKKEGRVVDVTGRATEVMEYRGRKMLRITDGKTAIGVITQQADVSTFQGGTIRVVGRMHRDGGYPYIDATQVSLVEGAQQLAA